MSKKDYKNTIPSEFWMAKKSRPVATSVGELISILKNLPEELQLNIEFSDSVEIFVSNVSTSTPIVWLIEHDYSQD